MMDEENIDVITNTLSEMKDKDLDATIVKQETIDSFKKEKDKIPNSEKIEQILRNFIRDNKDNKIEDLIQKSALLAILYDLDVEYEFSFSNTYKTLHIKIRSQIDNSFLTSNQKDFKKYYKIPSKRSGNLGIAKGFINFKNRKSLEVSPKENMAFSIFNSVGVFDNDNDVTLTDEINNVNEMFISSPKKRNYYETVKGCGKVGNTNDEGVENVKNRTWRFNDSECKIIEKITSDINEILEKESNELLNGKIEIFTERPPCRSCRCVMEKFKSKYESIIIDVIDGYGNKITIGEQQK